LLLLSGIGASLELFEPFVDALDPATGVIQLDVPGVGCSDTPRWPYRLGRLARTVELVANELGYTRADVLGVSWGGLLAQHVAGRHPSFCRRLVLVSTAPCTGAVPGNFLLLKELLSRRRYMDSEYAAAIAPVLYGGGVRSNPSLVNVLHNGVPASDRGYLYQLLAGLWAVGPPVIPRILQPTLILTGDDDPLIPLINARVLRAALPNARLRIFDDGHLGLLTRATELAPLVEEFLRGPDASRRGHVESAVYLSMVTARQLVRLAAGFVRSVDPTGAVGEAAVVRAAEELPLLADSER
jgi:poly(3-hydroxyalkanoate) depolymerase